MRRRGSGTDGAYRVLEKMAQRRSVNFGDPASLALHGSGSQGPPLMVHRTGSAPPAPGAPQHPVSPHIAACAWLGWLTWLRLAKIAQDLWSNVCPVSAHCEVQLWYL